MITFIIGTGTTETLSPRQTAATYRSSALRMVIGDSAARIAERGLANQYRRCFHVSYVTLARIDRILSMSSSRAITLRPPSEEDFDILFQIAADLTTWEERSAASPAPLGRDTFKARLSQADADGSAKSVRFVIDVDGAAVGSVSLFDFDELARHAEVGIALVPEARGNGIGTEALSQIVEFAFVRCNLRRVHLQVIASNLGAIRAYEKAGFVIEGRLRQHAWVRGNYEDIVVMGILRSA
ncbi:GNAT family N-acetyltransferase [Paeniglutamicibacter sp. MACA_103]|uniref:GNAT family N-acetyltransferase n=1 Tax=Paeniglutamicibacter sp. MACA_103 TaxID=3377337 RepID=UPI003893865A